MVTISFPNRSLCPTLKCWKWGYLAFGRKRLEPRECKRHYGYYLISFMMNISGVKFEEHCFYISRDILYSVFYHLSCKPNDIITYLTCIIQKTSISLKWKKIFQKGKRHSYFFFWKGFQISSSYFSFHTCRHFKKFKRRPKYKPIHLMLAPDNSQISSDC